MRALALVVLVALLGAIGVVPAAAAMRSGGETGGIAGDVTLSTGQPYANGAVLFIAVKNGMTKDAVTEPDGSYEVDLEPGVYFVKTSSSYAVAPGHVYQQFFEDADGWIPVHVEDGFVTTGVDILVAEAGSISGAVTYDASVPAEVALGWSTHVTPLLFDPATGIASQSGFTMNIGDDGVYTIQGLVPGEYTLRFSDIVGDSIITEYLGDAPWLSEASTFTVAAGDELTGLDAVISSGEHVAADVFRFDGEDRFEAAVSLSAETIPTGDPVPVVYIVNGLGFADALSAGPAAAYEGGVLLTVRPTSIPLVVKQELERLNPDRIQIVGGPASVSEAVKSQLQLIAPTTRIDGLDRFEVSRAVADSVWGEDGVRELFMVTGHNFPDALSAGSIAAIRGAPVVLVNSYVSGFWESDLDAATRALIVGLGAGEVHIVGGPASVTGLIEAQLFAMPELYLVDRFGGEDRFEASTNLAAAFPQNDVRFLATGYNYPDALAGSWLAGRAGGAVILIPGTCIPSAASALFDEVGFIGILGGTASVTPAVESGTVCS